MEEFVEGVKGGEELDYEDEEGFFVEEGDGGVGVDEEFHCLGYLEDEADYLGFYLAVGGLEVGD